MATGFDFSNALRHVKDGYVISRDGWNGKGMYVTLLTVEGLLPFLALRTVDGDSVPWLASQTDILATDWQATPQASAG